MLFLTRNVGFVKIHFTTHAINQSIDRFLGDIYLLKMIIGNLIGYFVN